ncbi:hypothetical protein L9F63_014497, partial [Diploptera punctata]
SGRVSSFAPLMCIIITITISDNIHSSIHRNQSICNTENPDVKLTEDVFDSFTNDKGTEEKIKRFTLTNQNGMTVEIINYGAIITSIKVPDKHGVLEDVVLGYDDMKGYLNPKNPYFGCIVGRVANRISKGKFTLDGKEYNLTLNRGTFQLHDATLKYEKVWSTHVEGNRLMLTYLSECGEEGYPGDLLVQATYQLSPDNELILDMTAMSTKPTPINLTNHSYFNLAGHSSGRKGTSEHTMTVNADKYTEVDEDSIPTGIVLPIVPRVMGEVLKATGGIDHNYCINQCTKGGLTFVARATHPPSGRYMEVYSDQPGVQLYTGNFLPESTSGENSLTGKHGAKYEKQGAFCLETQNYPDAVNHANFPNSVLRPGQIYEHTTIYKFGVSE